MKTVGIIGGIGPESTIEYYRLIIAAYPINDTFGIHPNIDVVIHNKPEARIKRFAIECKFSEACRETRRS